MTYPAGSCDGGPTPCPATVTSCAVPDAAPILASGRYAVSHRSPRLAAAAASYAAPTTVARADWPPMKYTAGGASHTWQLACGGLYRWTAQPPAARVNL